MRSLVVLILILAPFISFSQRYAGIQGKEAPPWDIDSWIDAQGNDATFQLEDFRGKKLVLFCFQSWCPGCHKTGFPTLQYLTDRFKNNEDIAFVAVQTVFEGGTTNTFKKLKKWQKKYDLRIPFGHDDGDGSSHIVDRYATGGTPWFIVIDEAGKVIYNDYQIAPQTAFKILK